MLELFEKYVSEQYGAITMSQSVDTMLNPDKKRPLGIAIMGKAGAVPTHWNNSPFLAGGAVTSAFGANPKKKKKKTVLSYYEFSEANKKLTK